VIFYTDYYARECFSVHPYSRSIFSITVRTNKLLVVLDSWYAWQL